jgi:hypothetical protein
MMEVSRINPMITLFFTNQSFMFKVPQYPEEEKQVSLNINNNKSRLTLKKHSEGRTLLHQIVIDHKLLEIIMISQCTLTCFRQALTCITIQIIRLSVNISRQAQTSTTF